MSHKYSVGQRLKTNTLFERGISSVIGIIDNMKDHHDQHLNLEVRSLEERNGQSLYRCWLLDEVGVRTSEHWLYEERWLSPVHEFKEYDDLHTALLEGEINDVDFLEVLKNVF